MRALSKVAIALIVASPMLLTAGCAMQSDVDALRAEIDALNSDMARTHDMAQEAARDADVAAMEARTAANAGEQAAVEAKTAREKADRIYRQSLRK